MVYNWYNEWLLFFSQHVEIDSSGEEKLKKRSGFLCPEVSLYLSSVAQQHQATPFSVRGQQVAQYAACREALPTFPWHIYQASLYMYIYNDK